MSYTLHINNEPEYAFDDPKEAIQKLRDLPERDADIRDYTGERVAWKEADHDKAAPRIEYTERFADLIGEPKKARDLTPAPTHDEPERAPVERDIAGHVAQAPALEPETKQEPTIAELVIPERADKPGTYYVYSRAGELEGAYDNAREALSAMTGQQRHFPEQDIYIADEAGNRLAWKEQQTQYKSYGYLEDKIDKNVLTPEFVQDVASEATQAAADVLRAADPVAEEEATGNKYAKDIDAERATRELIKKLENLPDAMPLENDAEPGSAQQRIEANKVLKSLRELQSSRVDAPAPERKAEQETDTAGGQSKAEQKSDFRQWLDSPAAEKPVAETKAPEVGQTSDFRQFLSTPEIVNYLDAAPATPEEAKTEFRAWLNEEHQHDRDSKQQADANGQSVDASSSQTPGQTPADPAAQAATPAPEAAHSYGPDIGHG